MCEFIFYFLLLLLLLLLLLFLIRKKWRKIFKIRSCSKSNKHAIQLRRKPGEEHRSTGFNLRQTHPITDNCSHRREWSEENSSSKLLGERVEWVAERSFLPKFGNKSNKQIRRNSTVGAARPSYAELKRRIIFKFDQLFAIYVKPA